MKIFEREKAISLRKKGKSINQIVKETGFSKASVSLWVRDVILTKNQKNRISERGRSMFSIEKRRINRIFNEKAKRRIIINIAKKKIKSISNKELLIIGVMLYLGEGGKTKRMVRLSNSDPDVIKIMMKFFRTVCDVPEDKFRGQIHIHSHLEVKRAEKYWSNVSKIPISRFYKTYSKQSIASLNKKDSTPNGTFEIYVNDVKVFLSIMGWIEKIKELVL